jgi:hypothetical protein
VVDDADVDAAAVVLLAESPLSSPPHAAPSMARLTSPATIVVLRLRRILNPPND